MAKSAVSYSNGKVAYYELDCHEKHVQVCLHSGHSQTITKINYCSGKSAEVEARLTPGSSQSFPWNEETGQLVSLETNRGQIVFFW